MHLKTLIDSNGKFQTARTFHKREQLCPSMRYDAIMRENGREACGVNRKRSHRKDTKTQTTEKRNLSGPCNTCIPAKTGGEKPEKARMALWEIGNVCLSSYNIAKVSNVWRAQEKNLQKTVPREGLTHAPGGLTLLRLATEVELGPLRRHYEQQGGHEGGHGGVRRVPSRESTRTCPAQFWDHHHSASLLCVYRLSRA